MSGEKDLQGQDSFHLRSESDLLVFISSVTEELKLTRQAAKEAVLTLPFARPWLFEDSPASSEALSAVYLRKVKEADIVIWLIGSETSKPVVDEINTCMSAGHPLLAFKLPAQTRDDQTQKLIAEVGQNAKWKEINDERALPGQIIAALCDELLRNFRNPEPPMRRNKLTELVSLSVSRTRQMWISLGVPDDLAEEFSEDHSVGDVISPPDPGLHMVVGDQGIGKTLAVERLFQRSGRTAMDDSSQPFPLFVKARDLHEPLNEYVDRLTQGYSLPSVQGSFVVVDGVDEVGISEANALVEQFAAYVHANPKAVVVVTARPLPGLNNLGERMDIQPLDTTQVARLIAKIGKRQFDLRDMHTWSRSTQDAAGYPLFAVMIGIALGRDPNSPVPAPSQMVEQLARTAIGESSVPEEKAYRLLQTLAVKTISMGASVSKETVSHSIRDHALLKDSRFVNEFEGKVDFTLSVFREWFAARALIEGTISVESIQPFSDRWIMPLAIVLESDNETIKNELMFSIVSSDPSLASLLLTEHESIQRVRETAPRFLDDHGEIGQRIRAAMETWKDGIGNLYTLIGPGTERGSVPTIGIRSLGDQYFHMSWYGGKGNLTKVVELPVDICPSLDWPLLVTRGVPNSQVWPWLITRTDLVEALSEWLNPGHLPIESRDALHELSWEFARAANRHADRGSVPIDALRVLRQIDHGMINVYFYDRLGARYVFSEEDTRLIRRHLSEVVESGNESIIDPWPSEDRLKTSGWPWEGYSDEQLLRRTNAVYTAGLRIYRDIVDRWFGSFRHSLQMFQLLPVNLEGFIIPSYEESPRKVGPVLSWRTRSLPIQQESTASFVLERDRQGNEDWHSYWANEQKNLAAVRPSLRVEPHPMSVGSGVYVFEPRPATALAYKWLLSDLRQLDWTDVIA